MAYLSAGTKFEINETVISSCLSTPDLGAVPEKVDKTTLDSLVNREYLKGLQDTKEFNLDFIQEKENFIAAQKDEKNENNAYKITFPSGLVGKFNGEHSVYPIATAPNQPEKFRVSVIVGDQINFSFAS